MTDLHSPASFIRGHIKEIILLIVFGGLLLYIYSTQSFDFKFVEPPKSQDYALHLEDVVIDDYWQTRERWKLVSKKAVVTKNSSIVSLTAVTIFVYDSEKTTQKEVDVTIIADKGEVNWDTQMITLESNVKIKRKSEIKMYTEKVIYHYEEGELFIPQSVDIQYLEAISKAQSLTYTVSNKIIHFQKMRWYE